MNNSSNTNKLVVPGAKQAIERMKYEIANELGISQAQISRIEKNAIKTLKKYVK